MAEPSKVGLLVPVTINDPIWGSKGYKGLLKIQSELKAEVFYKEGVNSGESVRNAVKEFSEQGITLIYGHGSEYEPFFKEIHNEYPNIHFIYFNGQYTAENVTSLAFSAHAMGFFGGMVAARMSETQKLGIIAAYEWQPEIKGFVEGAAYEDESSHVSIHYTNDWDDVDEAMEVLKEMLNDGVDVLYPAGDAFNIPVIEKVKSKSLYAIGFVSDQSDFGQAAVLTSTVQHVDQLYALTAKQYLNGELKSEVISFDFKDGVISMGKYSPEVPEDYQQYINELIEKYKENGTLPLK